jgi:predicted ArsR family transcriptional regulator
VNEEQRRYRVLAGISRSRLVSVLRQAKRPMGIRELADKVGLHPNTAREHLDQLVATGFVERVRAEPTGRGRPSFSYLASASDGEGDASAYRALASVLATELASRDDTKEAAASAGERWGRSMAAGHGPAPSAAQGVERLVGLLEEVGFAPEAPSDAEAPIRLRHCPFGTLARERGDVVCGVHLGLMRGALRELDAPLDAIALEPFVERDLCLAHLAARPA